jgi:Autotransporter beta-domain
MQPCTEVLEVSFLNGFRPSAGDAFAVLLTKGTRTGLFDHLNDFFNNNPNIAARLQPIEVYAPNGVALVYVAPAPGQSPNPMPPIIDVIATPLPPVALEEPLPLNFVVAALNPTIEQLTSMFEIPFSGANSQRFNLDNRLAEIQRGSTGFVSTIPTVPQPEAKTIVPQGKSVVEKQSPVFQPTGQNRWGVWVNGWGDWVSVDNDNSIKGYDFTTGGGSVGIDYRITDCLAVGLFGTYAHTWTNLSPGDMMSIPAAAGCTPPIGIKESMSTGAYMAATIATIRAGKRCCRDTSQAEAPRATSSAPSLKLHTTFMSEIS